MNDPLLTIPEFCRAYKISRSLFYRLLRERQIRAVKVGRLTRIRRVDAERWLKDLGAAKPTKLG